MYPRIVIYLSRVISAVFTPLYLPIIGLISLFTLSYLNMFPVGYIIHVILLALCFTVIFPIVLIKFYHRYHGWTPFEIGSREKRYIPYVISIVSYLICYNFLVHLRAPFIVTSIILAALAVQIVCAIINHWWKISTHSAGIGGFSGALVAYSLMFYFDPLPWLNLTILLAGLVGSARMILRQHSLAQVIGGYLIGAATSAASLAFL